MPRDDRREPVVKLRQAIGADGRILDERDRLGIADNRHQQRKAGLANFPEIIPGRIGQALVHAQNAGMALEALHQVVGLRLEVCLRVGIELRGKHGIRPALGKIDAMRVERILGGQVEDHPIEHLDGDWPGGHDLG